MKVTFRTFRKYIGLTRILWMKCKLHAFGIATCGSESYAGQNPTQQPSTFIATEINYGCCNCWHIKNHETKLLTVGLHDAMA